MRDPFGAFCPDTEVRLAGAADGPLAGLRFAAKDLYDVAGQVSGCGNPDWKRTHDPAERTAAAVEAWLGAGAELVGKTITDELAFSLNGENFHYGTPVNPAAPGRIPGGSSSGSASAVAGGLVDLALGTDTGGSIRVPAALCGIFGIRPTHGAVSLAGVMPLAPSFDVVGWFSRDPGLLLRAGKLLLPPDSHGLNEPRLLFVEDAFELLDEEVATVLREARGKLVGELHGEAGDVRLSHIVPGGDIDRWMDDFRTVQGFEIWKTHGDWIEATRPTFGPDVAERFAWAGGIDESDAARASERRESIASALDRFLAADTLLCIPTAPCIAPRRNADPASNLRYRERTLKLTCIAGLARVPQVAFPAGRAAAGDGEEPCPVGLSLIGRQGTDRALLERVERLNPE
jgi:amidase